MGKRNHLSLVRPGRASPFSRPLPPDDLGEVQDDGSLTHFRPAPEVLAWVKATVLNEAGPLYNEDHAHLRDADLEVIWASSSFQKAQRMIVGTAEEVAMRAGGWQRARMEEPFLRWFGRVPSFLITLAADYCGHCSDAEWCALVEHELYHLAQARDEFGAPRFTKAGVPVLTIRGHDVEEFVGVVRRYGAGRPESAVSKLVEAANQRPEVGGALITHACGTCQRAAA